MNGTGNFHGSLAPLAEAAARTRLGVVCVSIPLSPDGALGWPGRGPAAVRHRAILLARHLRFAVAVRRAPARPTLVREFSTIPLLWAATRLWTRRASLRFVVNHNLQWALNENAERVAFRWLDRLGFRFVFFEARPADALTRAGLRPDRHFDLPHPTSGAPAVRPPVGDIPRVGLIGHYRPEKGMDEALGVLLSGAAGRWRAAVGVPNVGEFLRRSPWAARQA